ncbi:hypothetical protein CK203_080828 [Vitis vinifera]|uniref:Uncharacterized protein n=1 Tax=Vitis vinifera TaxID=29760 RepID=A0A438F806_VITVI|nr:hypothetical protein CK203_080828 [Vitis vinifera]
MARECENATARGLKIMRGFEEEGREQIRSGVQGVQAHVSREKRKTPNLHRGKKERSLVLGRVGVESLGFLLEGLNHCIKDEKEGRWERDWKEQGRSYSLLRSANKAECFLRLGVINSKRKQYIFASQKAEKKKRDGLLWRKIYSYCEDQSAERTTYKKKRLVGTLL